MDPAQNEEAVRRLPWEQQEGEPGAAYVRFLIFRNLGACRTIAAARKQLDVTLVKSKNLKKPKIESKSISLGQWYQESSEWKWFDRSQQWDIERLVDAGDRVHTSMADCMVALANMATRATMGDGLPANWKDILYVFKELAPHVPQSLTTGSRHESVEVPASETTAKIHIA